MVVKSSNFLFSSVILKIELYISKLGNLNNQDPSMEIGGLKKKRLSWGFVKSKSDVSSGFLSYEFV